MNKHKKVLVNKLRSIVLKEKFTLQWSPNTDGIVTFWVVKIPEILRNGVNQAVFTFVLGFGHNCAHCEVVDCSFPKSILCGVRELPG